MSLHTGRTGATLCALLACLVLLLSGIQSPAADSHLLSRLHRNLQQKQSSQCECDGGVCPPNCFQVPICQYPCATAKSCAPQCCPEPCPAPCPCLYDRKFYYKGAWYLKQMPVLPPGAASSLSSASSISSSSSGCPVQGCSPHEDANCAPHCARIADWRDLEREEESGDGCPRPCVVPHCPLRCMQQPELACPESCADSASCPPHCYSEPCPQPCLPPHCPDRCMVTPEFMADQQDPDIIVCPAVCDAQHQCPQHCAQTAADGIATRTLRRGGLPVATALANSAAVSSSITDATPTTPVEAQVPPQGLPVIAS